MKIGEARCSHPDCALPGLHKGPHDNGNLNGTHPNWDDCGPAMLNALEAWEEFNAITDVAKMPAALITFKILAARALKKARTPL